MLINDINLKDYNAILSNKVISPSSIDIGVEWYKKTLIPTYLYKDIKFLSIACKFTFTIKSGVYDDFEKVISKFTTKIDQCKLNFDDIPTFTYKCYLISLGEPQRITPWDWEIDVKWKGYKYTKDEVKQFAKSTNGIINNSGNLDTPCRIKIISFVDIIDVTLSGFSKRPIKVKNIKANIPVIIDGEHCIATEGDSNKFNDVDLLEFPKLRPGENSLSWSNKNITLEVNFKPRWL